MLTSPLALRIAAVAAAAAWLAFGLYAYRNPPEGDSSSNPEFWWLIWAIVVVSIVRPVWAERRFATSAVAAVWAAIWSLGLVGQIAFYIDSGNIGLIVPTVATVIALNIVAATSMSAASTLGT